MTEESNEVINDEIVERNFEDLTPEDIEAFLI
jgi:hypothetical protein